MKVLVLDEEHCGLDFAMRCRDWDHEVKLWIPKNHAGKSSPIGQGLVDRIDEWKSYVKWADLILMTGNSMYRSEFDPLFKSGLPVLGANPRGAEIELDRAKGQDLFDTYGIETAPYEVFNNFDKALKHVEESGKGYAIKPWGGAADKSLSFVATRPDDIIFKLRKWKDEGKLNGQQFILQELIEGVEMAVSGWFGPGGWSQWIEENWEEKKFMNDNLGCNTGEQGTTMRYVKRSKLFDRVLRPLTEFFDSIEYVGNVDVNCIVDEKGVPWPLEFTTRLGWPAFNIHYALHQGDPAEWMVDLLNGKDSLDVSTDVAVGVVLTHGDYPAKGSQTLDEVSGYPLRGVTVQNLDHLHMQQVKVGPAPVQMSQGIVDMDTFVTAGEYVLVATGTGPTVSDAQKACYKTAWEIDWASNKMMRTDISKRLKKDLPKLQQHSYAKGMRYA